MGNFHEILWGTNLTSAIIDPASSLTGTDFVITWPVFTHRTYQLEASADLHWQTAASGAPSSYTEHVAALNSNADADGDGLPDALVGFAGWLR